MKTKMLKIVAILLITTGIFFACDKDTNDDIWIHIPVHGNGDAIMLTFNSEKNRAYVTTSPENFDTNGFYLLRNGQEFIVSNDTIYYLFPDGTYPNNIAFAITRLSSNKIELSYLGILPDTPFHVRNYLFNRKNN